MSDTPGNERETSPYNNEASVKSEEAQQVDVASPLLASGKEESKDIESEATPMDTDNGQAAQGEHKQLNSNSTPSIVDINTLTPSTPSQTPPQLLAAETSSTTATTTTTTSGAASIVVATTTATAIPENILSPPKSETQTDETNTATSTSCSPASEGQRSPLAEAEQLPPPPEEPITPKKELEPEPDPSKAVNGIIPKSGGKPLAQSALNKKINKSATTSPRASRARKTKTLPMYESEISDNKVGIKLCIKKSDAVPAAADLPIGTTSASPVAPAIRTAAAPSKSARKRVRKPKPPQDSDESEYEPRKKKGGGTGSSGGGGSGSSNNGERQKKISTSGTTETETEPVEQSAWGQKLPEEVLFRVRGKHNFETCFHSDFGFDFTLQIFQHVVDKEGCLPTLCRLGRVCSLWRQVSLRPTLWRTMDLTTWIKEKYRTELKLKWFVDNRCSACTELNVCKLFI